MKRPQLIILLGVLLILVVTGAGYYSWATKQVGTVVINLNTTPKNLKITFNGNVEEQKTKKGSAHTFVLPKNNYRLAISAPGYKPFATNFQLATGDQYRIAAHLEFLHDPTIVSAGQVSGLSSATVISDITYFHGQTWAVLQLTLPSSDPTFAAAQYDAIQNRWTLRAGPGTYFSEFSVKGLPDDVANNLTGGLE